MAKLSADEKKEKKEAAAAAKVEKKEAAAAKKEEKKAAAAEKKDAKKEAAAAKKEEKAAKKEEKKAAKADKKGAKTSRGGGAATFRQDLDSQPQDAVVKYLTETVARQSEELAKLSALHKYAGLQKLREALAMMKHGGLSDADVTKEVADALKALNKDAEEAAAAAKAEAEKPKEAF